jgi:hypothetical protein
VDDFEAGLEEDLLAAKLDHEARQPAELGAALRSQIEDALFAGWLAGRMKEAAFDLGGVGASR